MATHKLSVGLYPPASMRPMVWRVTPTASAKSDCERPAAARAVFMHRFFLPGMGFPSTYGQISVAT